MIDEPDLRPGDSSVQRSAELIMVKWLSTEMGITLTPKTLKLPDGSWLELDAFSEEPLVVGEAWAHQGPPKSAQKAKVMCDAMKLLAARRVVGDAARAILLFADEKAAARFRTGTWHAAALAEARIEVRVAALDADLRAAINAAQVRQYR